MLLLSEELNAKQIDSVQNKKLIKLFPIILLKYDQSIILCRVIVFQDKEGFYMKACNIRGYNESFIYCYINVC